MRRLARTASHCRGGPGHHRGHAARARDVPLPCGTVMSSARL